MKKETLSIRFLYGTVAGRAVLKPLVHPVVSRLAGKLLSTRISACAMPWFIKRHHIDMEGYEEKRYRSFNDFFTRKRVAKPADGMPGHLASPCDGYLSVYPVDGEKTYHIKNVEYSLEELLGSRMLADRFSGGRCLIFRLTPQDYHRYCYACDGTRIKSGILPGVLHCVRPTAYTSVPVFVQNSREYTVLRTDLFGTVVQMEIGALLVGKIHNYHGRCKVKKGQEKGFFEFGGSTVLILVEKDRLELAGRVVERTKAGREMKIRMGETVGVRNDKLDTSVGEDLKYYNQ